MEENNKEKISVFKKNTYNNQDASNVFLWAIVLPYVLSFLFVFSMMGVLEQTENLEVFVNSLPIVIISAILTPLAFILLFFIYNKVKKVPLGESLLTKKISWKICLLMLAISLLCVFGLQYLIATIDLGLKSIGYQEPVINLPLDSVGFYFLNVLLLAVLPAISEELVFRGMIFNGLKKNHSNLFAVLISSLLFALIHGNLTQFLYPFLVGIILSMVVLRTGSLISAILVHFFNNFIAVTLGFVENMTNFSFYDLPNWLIFTLAPILALLMVGIFFAIDKFCFKHKNKEECEKALPQNKNLPMTLWVGILLAVILLVFNTVGSF